MNSIESGLASGPKRQIEVQRLMGRCMLRLQQYEQLMKTLLAHHELEGVAETLDARRVASLEKLANKSLGILVEKLFETYVVPTDYERDLLSESTASTERISMAISHRIAMEPERLVQTRTAIDELVTMRNELVHHLIERFDLWSDDGCLVAARHLEECYARVDHHYKELSAWVQGMNNARALLASFAETEVFHDVLVNGIAPDGSFDWPSSGVVRVLREVGRGMLVDGWAPLDMVVAGIATSYPDQTPAKYGCRTWRQVLSESRLFDLRYQTADDGRKVGWFRDRTAA